MTDKAGPDNTITARRYLSSGVPRLRRKPSTLGAGSNGR